MIFAPFVRHYSMQYPLTNVVRDQKCMYESNLNLIRFTFDLICYLCESFAQDSREFSTQLIKTPFQVHNLSFFLSNCSTSVFQLAFKLFLVFLVLLLCSLYILFTLSYFFQKIVLHLFKLTIHVGNHIVSISPFHIN